MSPGFIAVVNLPDNGFGVQAIQVSSFGYLFGANQSNQNYWPAKAYWGVDFPPFGDAHMAMNIAFSGAFYPIFPVPDALDASTLSYFYTPNDPAHIYVYCNFNPSSDIGSAFLAFNVTSGAPDYGIFTDLLAGNYTQNYGRTQFLWTGPGVNTMVFSPSAAQPWGDMAYSAPFNSFPERVLGTFDFFPSGFGITGPIFVASADNSNGLSPVAEVRVRGQNFGETAYFPTVGVPGYAWQNAPELSGAQRQQRAVCFSSPFYGTLASGMQDAWATVSPWNITDPSDPDYPDIQGIIYTPYWQGFQGLPVGVTWPSTAVAPWYGVLQNGVPVLIDSASPPQMFILSVQNANFATIFGVDNWVRMAGQ